MEAKECRQRSIAAEAAGDEARAIYWARREAAASAPLSPRQLVGVAGQRSESRAYKSKGGPCGVVGQPVATFAGAAKHREIRKRARQRARKALKARETNIVLDRLEAR